MYREIEGDLIALSLEGKFDVIGHGCNCFCTMGAGIAVAMVKAFGTDQFPLEQITHRIYPEAETNEFYEEETGYKGDVNKLGQIDYVQKGINLKSGRVVIGWDKASEHLIKPITIVNAYSQYWYGLTPDGKAPFDYPAFTLCMRKINHIFKGKHVALPRLGAGLAGGNWDIIKAIIMEELKDVDVTVVIYNK
jgi:O-acetyl-ADP-ribose deacetylase (regulator of RNase III)